MSHHFLEFVWYFSWIAIYLAGAAAVVSFASELICLLQMRRHELALDRALDPVLAEGNIEEALKKCESVRCVYARILASGFNSIPGGFQSVITSVSVTAHIEKDRLLERVKFVGTCTFVGAAAGMLGSAAMIALHSYENNTSAVQILCESMEPFIAGYMVALLTFPAYVLLKHICGIFMLRMENNAYIHLQILNGATVEDDEP